MIRPGGTVRPAKRTSNLFRPRAAAGGGSGLDVSGLSGVISLDTADPDTAAPDTADPDTATADVQGMCTYEQLVATTISVSGVPSRSVTVRPGRADGDTNRMIETAMAGLGGHKRLSSDVY